MSSSVEVDCAPWELLDLGLSGKTAVTTTRLNRTSPPEVGAFQSRSQRCKNEWTDVAKFGFGIHCSVKLSATLFVESTWLPGSA